MAQTHGGVAIHALASNLEDTTQQNMRYDPLNAGSVLDHFLGFVQVSCAAREVPVSRPSAAEPSTRHSLILVLALKPYAPLRPSVQWLSPLLATNALNDSLLTCEDLAAVGDCVASFNLSSYCLTKFFPERLCQLDTKFRFEWTNTMIRKLPMSLKTLHIEAGMYNVFGETCRIQNTGRGLPVTLQHLSIGLGNNYNRGLCELPQLPETLTSLAVYVNGEDIDIASMIEELPRRLEHLTLSVPTINVDLIGSLPKSLISLCLSLYLDGSAVELINQLSTNLIVAEMSIQTPVKPTNNEIEDAFRVRCPLLTCFSWDGKYFELSKEKSK